LDVTQPGLSYKAFLGFFVAKIQGLKSTTPKNDKKKQRELKIEISRLEAELEAKHDAEIQAV